MSSDLKQLTAQELANYPYRELLYVKPALSVHKNQDGSFLLESPIALKPLERSIPHLFKRQADRFPNRVWLAEKKLDGSWREFKYKAFDQHSDNIAQWFLNEGFGQSTPLMVLSENSIAHALIIMGAMKARIPVASISAPYSLMDKSLSKLKMVSDKLKPALIFAQCGDRYAGALAAFDDGERRLIVDSNASDNLIDFQILLDTNVNNVDESIARITHDNGCQSNVYVGFDGHT